MDEEQTEALLSELRTIRKWSRIQGLESMGRVLEDFNDRDLVIYNEADGESTLDEIGSKVDRKKGTLSTKFNEWSEMGIVYKEGRQWKHAAPLSSIGIDVPDLDD